MTKKSSKSPQKPLVRPRVVLASASPRRQQMLRQLGIPFGLRVSAVEEKWPKGMAAKQVAVKLAREKVLSCRNAGDLVIAMDTVVAIDNHILGKPKDQKDARKMLRLLSGRAHVVITGVAIAFNSRILSASETTQVFFREINSAEIEWYVATGEPFDKAGAYAIQGYARLFIQKVEGCYYNVIGFPIGKFQELLGKCGFSIYDLML